MHMPIISEKRKASFYGCSSDSTPEAALLDVVLLAFQNKPFHNLFDYLNGNYKNMFIKTAIIPLRVDQLQNAAC